MRIITNLGTAIALGAGIGVAMGAAFRHAADGVALGVAVGIASYAGALLLNRGAGRGKTSC